MEFLFVTCYDSYLICACYTPMLLDKIVSSNDMFGILRHGICFVELSYVVRKYIFQHVLILSSYAHDVYGIST